MRRRAVFATLALLVFAGWSRADDETFKVPFDTLQTQHIVVMVKINDKGPYRLIFDTGAPMVLINNRIAKDAGVIAKDDKSLSGSPLGPLGQNNIKTFEMGGLKTGNLAAVIVDHPTVSAIDKALGPVEGIVGLSLYAKYKMTIDYQAKELTFTPVDFTPPDILKSVIALVTNPNPAKKVLAPAGQWGFRVAKEPKDEQPGVDVKEVLSGSPAAQAGLKAGDRLLTLDGRWTDSVLDCYQAASFVPPGATARLTVQRDGKEIALSVKVLPGF